MRVTLKRVPKTAQIQLRVTPTQKAALVRRARATGLDLSAWILSTLLPERCLVFAKLVRSLDTTTNPAFVLAELHDLLAAVGKAELVTVTELSTVPQLEPVRANQLAAMIELRAAQLGVRPPAWVDEVPPLATPWFATSLVGLRLHLLCNSPPVFRRRNLFVDSSVGDRV
jgi:hypothetical protein